MFLSYQFWCSRPQMQSSLLFWNIANLGRRSSTGHAHDRQINRIFFANPSSNLNFFIDTGVDISVLPRSRLRNATVKDDIVLFAANGAKMPIFCTKTLKINLNLRLKFPWFFVTTDVSQPIIGVYFLKSLISWSTLKIIPWLTTKLNFHI